MSKERELLRKIVMAHDEYIRSGRGSYDYNQLVDAISKARTLLAQPPAPVSTERALLKEWLDTELDSMDEEFQPWLDSFTKRVEEILTQPPAQDEWIPVSERLPDSLKMVLMVCPESQRATVMYGYYERLRNQFMVQITIGAEPVEYTGRPVSHWMLLPAAPSAP